MKNQILVLIVIGILLTGCSPAVVIKAQTDNCVATKFERFHHTYILFLIPAVGTIDGKNSFAVEHDPDCSCGWLNSDPR